MPEDCQFIASQPSDEKPSKSDLWDIIKRYDSYIATINFKSGLITTFNFGVFAGLLVKASVNRPEFIGDQFV